MGRNYLGLCWALGCFCLGCRHKLTPHVGGLKDRTEEEILQFSGIESMSRGSQAPRAHLPRAAQTFRPRAARPWMGQDGTGWVVGLPVSRSQRRPCPVGQDKLPGLQPLPGQQSPMGLAQG